MWPKGKTINDAVVIGEQEGGLYKLKVHPKLALIHETVEPNELWHIRLTHVHYRALPLARKVLKVFQKFKQNMMEYTKVVRKERIQRIHFQVAKERKNESWKSSTPMYADQCHQVH